MKTIDIVMYHADCVDGMAAAWVARSRILELRPDTDLKLIPSHYHDKFDPSVVGAITDSAVHLHILDFSMTVGALVEIYRVLHFTGLTYIDHHPTGKVHIEQAEDYFTPLLPGTVTCIFKNGASVSGASLAWKHYHKGQPTPRGILRVADRDTWTFGFTDSKNFHAYAALFLTKPYAWDGVFVDSNFDSAVASGEAVRMHMDDIAIKYASKDKWQAIEYSNMHGAFLNINRENVSDTCEKILELYPEIGFVICFQVKPDTVKFDFRSRQYEDVFNCGEVAKLFGGGGHVGSGGVEVQKWSKEFHLLCSSFGIYLQ